MIDLRSDTVTRPSPEMRNTMANAPVGDDVFGEDPSVIALQEEVAAMLGKEAALYAPSGCMANQLGLKAHTTEGDEVIIESGAHIFNYETTAASFLSRIQLYPVIAKDRGILTAEDIAPAVRDKAYYMPITRLLAIENTHNRAGGTVYTVEKTKEVTDFARSKGIATHLDGARLWNACAALNVEPIDFGKYFDTVSVCFSKGLGAPVGSALCGSREMIIRAHRMRKIWGGGMRQAGIIAAGALYALRNNRSRLSEDNDNAKKFAEIIAAGTSNVTIDMLRVQTNIVLIEVGDQNIPKMISELKDKGVMLSRGTNTSLRAVTHMDVSTKDCVAAAESIVKYCNS